MLVTINLLVIYSNYDQKNRTFHTQVCKIPCQLKPIQAIHAEAGTTIYKLKLNRTSTHEV
jgi:hypothetical protein